MIRNRDQATASPEGGGGLLGSVPEVGQSLRLARARQGLGLEQVSAATGLPIAHLHALEEGTSDRLPDRVAVLKTLRHYADFLHLPGDRFVLSLVDRSAPLDMEPSPLRVANGVPADHWSGVNPVAPRSRTGPAGREANGSWDAVDVPTDPPRLPAQNQTGAVSVVSTGAGGLAGPDPAHITDPVTAVRNTPATGLHTTTAEVPVQPRVTDAERDRRPAPTQPASIRLLHLLVAIVLLALLVGAAGLVINAVRPQWLRSLGFTRAGQPTQHQSGTSHRRRPVAVSQVASNSAQATYLVHAPLFTVTVTAVGGPSWIEVTDAAHSTPLYASDVVPGQAVHFTERNSLTIQFGSSAARIAISVDQRPISSYVPQVAPYTLIYESAHN